MAVVGIGEVELAHYLPVPLTYVALPRREAGTRSAELAIALSRGDEIGETVVKLPVAARRQRDGVGGAQLRHSK